MYFWVSHSATIQLSQLLCIRHHSTSSGASEQKHYFTLPDCLACPDSRCDSRKVALFDLQGHYRPIRRHWFGVKRACHYSVVWQNSLPKGTAITSLSSFQLTPGKGIIGNHPCNAVPLWFLTAEWNHSTVVLSFRCKIRVLHPICSPDSACCFLCVYSHRQL